MIVGIISKNWLRSLVKGDEATRGEPGMDEEVRASTHDEEEGHEGVEGVVREHASADESEEEASLAGDAEEDAAEEDEEEEAPIEKTDAGPIDAGVDDPLAPAYDLEDGELFEEEDFLEEQKPTLPWSSRVQNAKDFFAAEVLYRFDILEIEERRALAGNYRFEIKGYQGGVWTLGVGDELTVVNRREDAEIVLTMYQRDFLQLVNGELNPQLAILAQKLRVQGDVRKAMAFQEIILPQREN